MTEKLIKFKITPKGWLFAKLVGYGVSKDEFDEIWDKFATHVSEKAAENGMRGMPCLVFREGGICITAEANHTPPIEDSQIH